MAPARPGKRATSWHSALGASPPRPLPRESKSLPGPETCDTDCVHHAAWVDVGAPGEGAAGPRRGAPEQAAALRPAPPPRPRVERPNSSASSRCVAAGRDAAHACRLDLIRIPPASPESPGGAAHWPAGSARSGSGPTLPSACQRDASPDCDGLRPPARPHPASRWHRSLILLPSAPLSCLPGDPEASSSSRVRPQAETGDQDGDGGQEGPGHQLCLLSSAPEGDRQNSSQDTESCPESHWKPRRRRLRNSHAREGGGRGRCAGAGQGLIKRRLASNPAPGSKPRVLSLQVRRLRGLKGAGFRAGCHQLPLTRVEPLHPPSTLPQGYRCPHLHVVTLPAAAPRGQVTKNGARPWT